MCLCLISCTATFAQQRAEMKPTVERAGHSYCLALSPLCLSVGVTDGNPGHTQQIKWEPSPQKPKEPDSGRFQANPSRRTGPSPTVFLPSRQRPFKSRMSHKQHLGTPRSVGIVPTTHSCGRPFWSTPLAAVLIVTHMRMSRIARDERSIYIYIYTRSSEASPAEEKGAWHLSC